MQSWKTVKSFKTDFPIVFESFLLKSLVVFLYVQKIFIVMANHKSFIKLPKKTRQYSIERIKENLGLYGGMITTSILSINLVQSSNIQSVTEILHYSVYRVYRQVW